MSNIQSWHKLQVLYPNPVIL